MHMAGKESKTKKSDKKDTKRKHEEALAINVGEKDENKKRKTGSLAGGGDKVDDHGEENTTKELDTITDPTIGSNNDVKKKDSVKEDTLERPLRWHPDEIHCSQLCDKCLRINFRWPPKPVLYPPPDKDPNLIYPGDVDPFFKPARGDIVIVHPHGLGKDPKPTAEDLWWKSKRIGGGYCICYDGDKHFKFEVGDLVLRIGCYKEGENTMGAIDDSESSAAAETAKGKRGSKKKLSLQIPKPKKIADPPELDPVTYKPYEKVELYSCTGFDIVKEEEPVDVDKLELELKKLFELKTEYAFLMGDKDTDALLSDNRLNQLSDYANNLKNLRKKSQNATILINTQEENQRPTTRNEHREESRKGSIMTSKEEISKKNENDVPALEINSKVNSNLLDEKILNNDTRKKSLRTVALEASQASQRKLESQVSDINLNKESQSVKKAPKINLIWTFLGSQSQLQMNPEIPVAEESKCPGLNCFYKPYLNLGTTCKMEHVPIPNLGEIIIPEGVWFPNFNHRRNEWRSMVKWFIPPPSTSPRLEEVISSEDVGEDEVGKEPDPKLDKAKRKDSKSTKKEHKEKRESVDQTLEAKGKRDKKEASETDEKIEASVNKRKSQKGKEKVENEELNPNTDELNKEALVPEDLEAILKTTEEGKDLDYPKMSEVLKRQLVKGTILIRPLIGRKVEDVSTPLEEWKWPRKKKIWGYVEMYMVEWGGEGLRWVYWGRSERICDTAYPLSPPEAKAKFSHPDDLKIQIPEVVDLESSDQMPLMTTSMTEDVTNNPNVTDKDKSKKDSIKETGDRKSIKKTDNQKKKVK